MCVELFNPMQAKKGDSETSEHAGHIDVNPLLFRRAGSAPPALRTLSTTVQVLRFVDIHDITIVGFFDSADAEGMA